MIVITYQVAFHVESKSSSDRWQSAAASSRCGRVCSPPHRPTPSRLVSPSAPLRHVPRQPTAARAEASARFLGSRRVALVIRIARIGPRVERGGKACLARVAGPYSGSMQVPTTSKAGAAPASGDFLARVTAQFTDAALYVETVLVLLLAVGLGALLAYHPSARRKVTSRAALEQPKTFVMYALVGALVGHIVLLNEAMALVVFGIGGLMRFRTDVGEAKDTGRVILAAIVGICCGVQSYLIAVLATIMGWIIIWRLEHQSIGSVQVLGIPTSAMQDSSLAYRKLLEAAGCRVVGETRNPKKSQIEIVFTAPAAFDANTARAQAEELPENERGVPTWEIS